MHSVQAQIVVPVHKLDRPIRRAVESVLANVNAGCIVVAHGLDPELLDLPQSERLTVVLLSGGLGHPGAAFNAGIQATTAPFVGVLGSDDWFDPEALDTMIFRITAAGGDGILAPLRHAASAMNAQNPITVRRKRLTGSRDRLFNRTAPLGLFRREVFAESKFLFDDDVIAGVDQRNGALLYTSGLDILHYPTDPAYVVGDDAKSRVTTTVRPLSEHAEAWARLWQDADILALPRPDRAALAEKVLQVHILGLVQARPQPEDWPEGDFAWLSTLTTNVLRVEPTASRSLVRARARILGALLVGDITTTLDAQAHSSYLDWRLPGQLSGAFQRNFWTRVRFDAMLSRVRDKVLPARTPDNLQR